MNSSKLENARKEAKSIIDNLNIGYKDTTKKTGLGNIHAHKAKNMNYATNHRDGLTTH